MDLIHLKQEPGLVQHVQGEPALLVKEEILEDSTQDGNEQQCVQGTSTPAGTGSADEACSMSLGDLLNVKHELSDMDIGSTVLQHMDIYYTINQQNTSAIADVCNKPMMPYNQGIKKENVEDKLTDSSSKQPHISEEHKHRRYRCNKCVKVFKSEDCRNQHVKQIHGTLLHKCTQCIKEFKSKLYLTQHIYYSHSKGQHECDICKKMYKSRGALCSHVSNYHRNNIADSSSKPSSIRRRIEGLKRRVFRCNECLKVFKHNDNLWQHMTVVHGSESHKCSQCNKEFKCKQYLSKHVRKTHGKGKPECNICKTMYKSQRSLLRHVLLLHQDSSSKQPFKCNKCLKVFTSKVGLHNHINIIHGTGSHKCTQCDKEFKCKQYLLRHVQHTHSEVQYECGICKKMCKTREVLRVHVSCFHRKRSTGSSSKHVHGSEEPEHKGYTCNKCMTVFKSEENRNKHIRIIHGTETHKCTQCNKEFKCKLYLTRHVRYVHSKQQNECEICKKMCTSRAALDNHFARAHRKKSTGSSSKHVHGSEEPKHKGYTCTKCMKVFMTEVYRNNHIRLLHGTETHKCTQCNKEFKCEQYLTRHVRYVHSKQQNECEICKKMCTSQAALNKHLGNFHRKKSTVGKPGNRGAATPSMASSVDVAACIADQCSEPTIKQESGGTDLDIGPTVLQHMDSHYTLNQVKVDHVKMESSPLTNKQIVKNEPNWSM